ncbi:RnfABCDGE type electron transport complex subunit G [bacterium]|nr:RnfABCDGE type electron transport complex subunit G [bacterium]
MKEAMNLSLRLALICAVAALALSQVASFTAEPIATAEYAAKMEAVIAVLPYHDNDPGTDAVELDLRTYYPAMKDGAVVGWAFRGVTQLGYSGEIEVMIGVDASGAIEGMRILRHAETPGLGANYSDADLLAGFFGGKTLAATDWRMSKDGGDIDAVTGATVTGRALADAVQNALKQFADDLPRLATSGEVDA